MPAELFRSDLPTTPARRRASLLPVSVAAHVAILAVVVLTPVLAGVDLPAPSRAAVIYTPVAPPPAPPPVRVQPAGDATTTSSRAKAPLESPAEVLPEKFVDSAGTHVVPDGGQEGIGGFGLTDGIALSSATPFAPPPPPVEKKPVRPGGNIEAPRIVRRVQPVYPTMAQASRVSGTVVIEALIGTDGRVRKASVSSGHMLLTDAALTAVRQWTFTPTRLNGEPVEVIMTVTVVFQLS